MGLVSSRSNRAGQILLLRGAGDATGGTVGVNLGRDAPVSLPYQPAGISGWVGDAALRLTRANTCAWEALSLIS